MKKGSNSFMEGTKKKKNETKKTSNGTFEKTKAQHRPEVII